MVNIRLLMILMASTVLLQAQNLMPLPAKMSPQEGRLKIETTFGVAHSGYWEPRLERATERLSLHLARKTGIPIQLVVSPESTATLVIRCDHASAPVQNVRDDESYQLTVTSTQAQLKAPTPLGIMHGMETFLQLVELDADGFSAPAVQIEDAPRFPWRGFMLDVSRHWMPMEVVKRNIDGMAALKLNVFHWHLSDNQGFRVQSKMFPKLTGMGSDGHYYTQDQVREIIAYARDRGIRVVPEFDMPGHSTSWFVGYPTLASAPGPYQIERHWGIFDPCMDPTRNEVYDFLNKFIGEMTALFPDEFFHVGGDEVNGKQWDANPRIQEFKRQHNMKTNEELQAYFIKRVQAIVAKHGKRMIGWDEILQPGLPKSTVVQSWRGQKSLAEASRQGYMGILSFGYYLDHQEPASYHYGVDPLADGAANLTDAEKARILGGEACMWAEMVNAETVDSRIWPRMAAIAERFWSPQNVTDVDSMYRRLAVVSRNLSWLGLKHRSNYYLMLERLACEHSAGPVKVLADIVEPVKRYARNRIPTYTQQTPLNRLVDAARPESATAREFGKMVDHLLAHRATADEKDTVRRYLALWQQNDAQLRPIMEDSALLKEDEPISADVSALGSAGLQALGYIDAGSHAPQEWIQDQQALLERAGQPRAELLLKIVAPIQKLIEAAR